MSEMTEERLKEFEDRVDGYGFLSPENAKEVFAEVRENVALRADNATIRERLKEWEKASTNIIHQIWMVFVFVYMEGLIHGAAIGPRLEESPIDYQI